MGKSTAVTCGVCGIQINRKADLKRHMKVHALNKEDLKHSCPYPGCTFRTLQKSNIVGHMNTHTGARPYKCQTGECKFKTSDRGSLTRHRKAFHGFVTRKGANAHTGGTSEAEKPSTSSAITSGSISPVVALPEAYKTPLPELPQTLEPCPLLVPSTDSMTRNGSKSSPVALRTDVFMGYPWVNNEQFPLVNSGPSSLPPSLAPGSLMSEDVPTLDYTQVPPIDQGNSQAVNLPAQPISGLPSSGVSNETLDDLFIQSDEFQTLYNSLFASSSTTVHDGSLPTPLPLSNALYNNFLSSDYYHYVDSTPMASGSQFVSGYDPTTSILPGWDSILNSAGSFDFGNSLFATPEMGIHNQDVNQIHPYITPAQSGGYPMH